jgi:putative transposase
MIEPTHPTISLRRQCELIGLPRSTYYYAPASESELNIQLMRRIDEQHLKTPFYGWPRMSQVLRREGYAINTKRVRRLWSRIIAR